MATARKSPARRTAPASSSGTGRRTAARSTSTRRTSTTPDAYRLLKADHAEVTRGFREYKKLVKREADAEERQALAQRLCEMLTVHATIEEELFYPAAREHLGEEDDLVDEADIEHASAKELIAQIQSATPDTDDHFDARVTVLSEYIAHHVKEEEQELFPKLRKAKLDAKTIGESLAERKSQLSGEPSGEME